MKKFTFKGGIHPPANKEAAGVPIKILPPPEVLVFPMQQHIGAPAMPTVKPGDRVLMYQLIGKATGGVSANSELRRRMQEECKKRGFKPFRCA